MPVLDANQPDHLARAAAALAQGELVAFPTETVYGLGARADDARAVAKIFAAKGRPNDHPLIVHVLDEAAALHFAQSLPAVAQRLMAAYWPGPLTVIVPRRAQAASACAAGQSSIGLRCPAHPVARALLAQAQALGVQGVAAPSANRFGHVSPTTAQHVTSEFDPELLVLDGGPCEVGIESAIVDCSRGFPVLLRPGALARSALELAAGEPLRDRDEQAPRASGTLASHYAPRSRVRLMTTERLQQAAAQWAALPASQRQPSALALYSREEWPGGAWNVQRMSSEAAQAAHDLFADLRAMDAQLQAAGGGEIWVQDPPDDPLWDGVRDRLMRAAA